MDLECLTALVQAATPRGNMIGIIGKKLGMTQIFNEQGQQIP